MDFTNIKTLLEEGILKVTISRPEKLNSLNQQTMDELSACLDWIYTNEEVKAVIITGEGEKAFVAGADISEFLQMDKEIGRKLSQKGQNVFFKIENSPKPIIAAVNGFALGGGCELALACHMRIASENALFAQPEVNLGIIPGYGGTQRLTALIGKGRALELMLTSDKMDAKAAKEIGLVNHVVPLPELISKSKEVLFKIISKPPVAVAMIINAANQAGSEKGYETEVNNFSKCTGSQDFVEGVTAFLEKRKGVFSGK